MIEERVKNVMASILDVPVSAIGEDSSPDTIPTWDSLRHMSLVMALESEFSVKFDDKQIFDMMNYRLVVMMIKEVDPKIGTAC